MPARPRSSSSRRGTAAPPRRPELGPSSQAARFTRPVFARLRRVCLALPGTTETASWGHPHFRAGGRVYCAFEFIGDRPSVAFRLDATAVAAMTPRADTFATSYGRGPWTSVRIDRDPDPADLQVLAVASHRAATLKRTRTSRR